MSAERVVAEKVRTALSEAEKARSKAAENIRSAVLEAYRTIDPRPTTWVIRGRSASTENYGSEQVAGLLVSPGFFENTYVEDAPGIIVDESNIYTFPGGRGHGVVAKLGSYVSGTFYDRREPISNDQCLKYAEMIAGAVDGQLNPPVPAEAR